jgi:hypothetical protein
MNHWAFTQLGTAIAIVVAVGACESSTTPTAVPPRGGGVSRGYGLPIRQSEVRQAGTPLRDGLSVPVGAVLAGTLVPENTHPSGAPQFPPSDHEWSAVLGIRGTPRAVADAILRQAKDAGWCCLPRAASCVTYTCQVYTGTGIDLTSPQGHSLSLQIVRDGDHRTWANLQVIDWGGKDLRPPVPDAGDPSEERAPGPPPTTPPADGRLPSTGELVGFGSYRPGFKSPYRVTVAPGSAMVRPVLEESAVLRVTGDSTQVRRRYERQLRSYFPGVRMVKRHERRGAWSVDVASAQDDAGSGTVELFSRSGQSYVRLRFATDEEFEP